MSNTPASPHQALIEQLDLMIRASYPLLYIVAVEEEPVEEVLLWAAAQSQPSRKILMWDIVRGWADDEETAIVMLDFYEYDETWQQYSFVGIHKKRWNWLLALFAACKKLLFMNIFFKKNLGEKV